MGNRRGISIGAPAEMLENKDLNQSKLGLYCLLCCAGFLVHRDGTGVWAVAEEDDFDCNIIPANHVRRHIIKQKIKKLTDTASSKG